MPNAEPAEDMIIPEGANVWEWKDEWYHRDETESIYGPFATEALAREAFEDYVDVELEGKRPMIRPAQLAKLEEIWKLQDEVANDDEALKNKKARLALAEEHDLGELLTERELTNGVRLPDGREYTFERKLHCSVASAEKPAAFAYLDQTNNGALLKRSIVVKIGNNSQSLGAELQKTIRDLLPQYEVSVRVGKAPEALAVAIRDIIERAGLKAEVSEELELPGATLRSFVTKQMKLGKPLPECFGVYAPMNAVMVPPAEPIPESNPSAAVLGSLMNAELNAEAS